MTNQTSSQDYGQASAVPFFGGNAIVQAGEPTYITPHFRSFRLYDIVGGRSVARGDEVGFEYLVEDLRGGIVLRGNISETWNKVTEGGTLNTMSYRALVLPQVTTSVNTASGSAGPISHQPAFSVLAIGHGGTANAALFKGNSDGSLTTITYTPGSVITALGDLSGLAATTNEYLGVARAGASVHVLSDLTTGGPTVAGTMHANLNPCWGFVKSPINNTTPGTNTFIFYANGGIWTLASSAAIGDAPTQVQSNVPNGGWVIGILRLLGVPTRIYMVIPKISSAASVIDWFNGVVPRTEVKSFNLEGTDPLPLPGNPLGEATCIAFPWREGLLLSDLWNIFYYDGQTYERIVWRDEVINEARCDAIVPIDEDLLIYARASSARHILRYNSRTRQCTPYAGTLAGLTVTDFQFANGHLPINGFHSYFFYATSNSQWYSQYIVRSGNNAYATRDTTALEASGSIGSPVQDLPWPFTGHPFHLDAIGFGGVVNTISAGGGNGTISVTAEGFGGTALFSTGHTDLWQWASNPDATSLVHKLSWTQSQVQDTASNTRTGNGLPMKFVGRVKIDVRRYQELIQETRAR